jgi:hypothetical protein
VSSRASILSLISEKAKIRMDNRQNKISVLIIFTCDFLINFKKIIKEFIS